MTQWQKLKEMKFERGTLALYRSNAAMNAWLVEFETRTGNTQAVEFEKQSEAYNYFYGSARMELDHDAYQWSEEIRI